MTRTFHWPRFVFALALLLGALYSGTNFFAHFTDAIPQHPKGGGLGFMTPGDQFEQLNRYTMAGTNLLRGRNPYYQAYQYNAIKGAPEFTEGLVGFPFSFAGGLLAVPFGDAAAFNLLVLLSYPLAAVCGFLLCYRVSGDPLASCVACLILVTLPFRTAFLYGELVYGIDMCLLPLAIYLYEGFLEKGTVRSSAWFGLCLFCAATANIQSTYFFLLLGSPYFAISLFLARRGAPQQWRRTLAVLVAACAPAGIYLLYVKNLIDHSGKGVLPRSYDEVLNFAPGWEHMWHVFSGNERSVMIGFPLLIVLGLLFYTGASPLMAASRPAERRIWLILGPMFVASYLACLGPAVDRLLHLPLYREFFFKFPGGSATRTPGRIMAVAGCFFMVLFALALARILRRAAKAKPWLPVPIACAVGALIVIQNWYTSPTMVQIKPQTPVYASLTGTAGRVLALPFFDAPDHYMNALYTYLGRYYDLRMFNGHSSYYPAYMIDASRKLADFNSTGRLDEKTWRWLRNNEYTHVIAHRRVERPRIDAVVLHNLSASPYLSLEKAADDIYDFTILSQPRALAAESTTDFYNRLADSIVAEDPKWAEHPVHYLDGWYNLEAYPGQRPFRWMKGTNASLIVLDPRPNSPLEVSFASKCPFNDLTVEANGRDVQPQSSPLADGWRQIRIAVPAAVRRYDVFDLHVSRIFTVSTDPRSFGCMIGEIETKVPDTTAQAGSRVSGAVERRKR